MTQSCWCLQPFVCFFFFFWKLCMQENKVQKLVAAMGQRYVIIHTFVCAKLLQLCLTLCDLARRKIRIITCLWSISVISFCIYWFPIFAWVKTAAFCLYWLYHSRQAWCTMKNTNHSGLKQQRCIPHSCKIYCRSGFLHVWVTLQGRSPVCWLGRCDASTGTQFPRHKADKARAGDITQAVKRSHPEVICTISTGISLAKASLMATPNGKRAGTYLP